MAASSTSPQKIDLRKSFGALYKPRAQDCVLITPPLFNILAIEGAGDPNTAPAWQAAVEALYTTAYTLKFMLKQAGATPDYSVMPLEALWWVAANETFSLDDKSNWLWRALIVQPDFVTHAHVMQALDRARKKKNNLALEHLTFVTFGEGPSAQVMHNGPYADEAVTIKRLNAFIHAHGFVQAGKHHEIYLTDPQRTTPARMQTIVRLPIGHVLSHI